MANFTLIRFDDWMIDARSAWFIFLEPELKKHFVRLLHKHEASNLGNQFQVHAAFFRCKLLRRMKYDMKN